MSLENLDELLKQSHKDMQALDEHSNLDLDWDQLEAIFTANKEQSRADMQSIQMSPEKLHEEFSL